MAKAGVNSQWLFLIRQPFPWPRAQLGMNVTYTSAQSSHCHDDCSINTKMVTAQYKNTHTNSSSQAICTPYIFPWSSATVQTRTATVTMTSPFPLLIARGQFRHQPPNTLTVITQLTTISLTTFSLALSPPPPLSSSCANSTSVFSKYSATPGGEPCDPTWSCSITHRGMALGSPEDGPDNALHQIE